MPNAEFDVFLSHNSADKPEVLKLATKLKDFGLNPWVDAWHLVAGEPWLPAIERALANSDSCAVIVGPNGLGSVHEDEMWVALQRGIESKRADRRFRIIPILLPKAIRGDRTHLPTFLTANTWVEFPQTIDDPLALDKLVKAIRGQAPGAGTKLSNGECPYRGLAHFDIPHANLFFGREALTDWLLSRLRGTATKAGPTRFLAIIGASGSGKSSLARAGVLARFKAGELPGSANWPMVVCRPESRPLESLATKLASLEADTLGPIARSEMIVGLIRSLQESPEKLHLVTQAAMPDNDPDWRLVVFVDQFEELFTLNVPDSYEVQSGSPRSTLSADRIAFFRNLLHAATIENGRTIVILTMRADFYGKCAAFPELADAVSAYQQLVGPMGADELRRAIETPAQLSGGDIEPGLVDLLVREVADQPGALPLLQYALAELWNSSRKSGQSKLTTAAYRALGGWEGALSRRADAVLAEFKNTPQEKLCRELFLRLVQPGEGTEDTKRLVRWAELSRVNSSESAALELTVRKLADNRLITTGGESQSGEALKADATIEVVHEALIRGWGELRNWLESNRAGLRIHRQLTEVANEWANSHSNARQRDPSLLYTGTRLAVVQDMAKRGDVAFNDIENGFLDASTHAVRAQKQRLMLAWAGTGTIIVLLSLVGALIARNIQNDDHAQVIVENLKNESQAPDFVKAFEKYRPWTDGRLRKLFDSSDNDSSAKLHAALALAPVDTGVISHLRNRLLTTTSAEFPLVRDSLQRHDRELGQQIEELWKTAEDATVPISRRFQAACALATYAPEDTRWSNIASIVAEHLVGLSATDHVAWRAALRPSGDQLIKPLTLIFQNSSNDSPLRQFAAETLTDYARNNGTLLGELLLTADPRTFESLVTAAGKVPVDAVARLRQELEAKPRRRANRVVIPNVPALTEVTEDDRDDLARRQSHAGVALARLGHIDSIWALLAIKQDAPHAETFDPRLKTELIHDLAVFRVDSVALFERIGVEKDVSSRRALLLALGQYPVGQLPADRQAALIDKLMIDFETEADAGLHGAIEWLLRAWNRGDDLRRIIDRLKPKVKAPLGHRTAKERQWYLNGQGQTFTVFPSGEFLMGSPESEFERDQDETPHRRKIERPFALATTEVTREQYLAFVERTGARDPANRYGKSFDSPQTGIEWYEAAHYCNWLSEQEGIDRDQWCFERNEQGQYGPGMKAKKNFLNLTGYRLPTEAEWEYACRAGAGTSRYFGNSKARLGNFAWYQLNSDEGLHPVGGKKPNDAGLFDILGNALEWCHDAVSPYPAQPSPVPMLTDETANMETSLYRVLRGASFGSPTQDVRSACRSGSRPEDHLNPIGFRPARTMWQADGLPGQN